MKLTSLKLSGIALGLTLFPSHARCEDWAQLFKDLTSTDRGVSDPARQRVFQFVVPQLQKEDAAALDEDIAGILPQFEAGPKIRLQASALLAGVAYARPDAESAMARALPVLIGQLQDPDPRLRYNAAFGLSTLKPGIPANARDPLIAALRDPEPRAARGAVYGVARFAETSGEAAAALAQVITASGDLEMRRTAIRSIAGLQLKNPVVTAALGRALNDSQRDIVKESLLAIRAVGPGAVGLLRQQIEAISRRSEDRELSETATSILSPR